MSVDIIVQRGAGDAPGQDIVDSLLGTVDAAIVRGRVELDENGGGSSSVSIDLPMTGGLRRGMLVQVDDTEFGITWIGKIESVSHSWGGLSEGSTIRVRRKL